MVDLRTAKESLTVNFIWALRRKKVKGELGIKALHREFDQVDGTYPLRESGEAYGGQVDIKMRL